MDKTNKPRGPAMAMPRIPTIGSLRGAGYTPKTRNVSVANKVGNDAAKKQAQKNISKKSLKTKNIY